MVISILRANTYAHIHTLQTKAISRSQVHSGLKNILVVSNMYVLDTTTITIQ